MAIHIGRYLRHVNDVAVDLTGIIVTCDHAAVLILERNGEIGDRIGIIDGLIGRVAGDGNGAAERFRRCAVVPAKERVAIHIGRYLRHGNGAAINLIGMIVTCDHVAVLILERNGVEIHHRIVHVIPRSVCRIIIEKFRQNSICIVVCRSVGPADKGIQRARAVIRANGISLAGVHRTLVIFGVDCEQRRAVGILEIDLVIVICFILPQRRPRCIVPGPASVIKTVKKILLCRGDCGVQSGLLIQARKDRIIGFADRKVVRRDLLLHLVQRCVEFVDHVIVD